MTIPSTFSVKPINVGRRRLRGRNRFSEAVGPSGSENRGRDDVEHFGPVGVKKRRIFMAMRLTDGQWVDISGGTLIVPTPRQISDPEPVDYLILSSCTLNGATPGKAFAPSVIPSVLYAPQGEFVSYIAARVAELITRGGAHQLLAPAGEIDPLAAARIRGRDSMRALMDAPENLALADAANSAHASERHINSLRKKHLLYALVLDGSNRGYRYPQWQFAADPRRLKPVLSALADKDLSCWAIHEFMCRRHPDLKMPPRDAILDAAVDIKHILAAVDQRFSDADQGAA